MNPHQVFEDRREAGRKLALRLEPYRRRSPVVVALPRGGVVVGYEVARALDAPLEVVVARKLGAPGHPELGIGAIAPGGVMILDRATMRHLGVTEAELREVAEREAGEMRRRMEAYRGANRLPYVDGRTVLLVDDGLATGVTAIAAARSLRHAGAARIVLAVPVCGPDTFDRMRDEVDEVVCGMMPDPFVAVGAWYRNFEQTTDAEVIELLEEAADHVSTSSVRDAD